MSSIDYDPETFARELGLDARQITDDGITVTFDRGGLVMLRWTGIKTAEVKDVNAAMAAAIQAAREPRS